MSDVEVDISKSKEQNTAECLCKINCKITSDDV